MYVIMDSIGLFTFSYFIEKPKKTFNKPKPKHHVSPSIKKPWNSGTNTANKKTPSSLPSSRTRVCLLK